MRPEEYVAILARRWWVLLVAGLAAGLVAFLYSSAQPPTYQVSVRLLAVARPPDYWLDLYAKNRLASYQDLIRSWDFVSQALQRAGLPVETGYALSTLSLGRQQDSNLVQIVVTDSDPARAAAIANAVADAFVERSTDENRQILDRFSDPRGERIPGTVEIIKLDSPGPPQTPVGPRVRLNSVAGVLLGLALGIVSAFGMEYFDDRLRTEREVQRYLALASVGRIGHRRASRWRREERSMRQGNERSGLVVATEPLSVQAEAYRTLRAALVFAAGDRPLGSVLVVDAESTGDSPAVAANLAATLARTGDRVALVDADLRSPRLHELLGLPRSPGLAEWLVGEDEAALPVIPTAYERLSLVAAGELPSGSRLSPGDLLMQSRFAQCLIRLGAEHEKVVIAAPPAGEFGDALAVASRVDGVLLVVRSGRTRRSVAQAARQALDRVGARLVGAVLVQG